MKRALQNHPQAGMADKTGQWNLGEMGLTLVELMVAVSILAILAVLAAPPMLQWNANRRLMKQASTLYSQMQQAKLEAIRNNCDVVVNLVPPTGYQVFLDNGGAANDGIAGNQIQEGSEMRVAAVTMTADILIQIAADQFGGTTVCGFTSRGLPLLGRSGMAVFRRGLTDRWYRVALAPSGQLTLQNSGDSTDGVDGTWD